MLHDKRGQNTVEYMLLLAIILIFLISVLSPTGFFSDAIQNSLNAAALGANSILQNTW